MKVEVIDSGFRRRDGAFGIPAQHVLDPGSSPGQALIGERESRLVSCNTSFGAEMGQHGLCCLSNAPCGLCNPAHS